MHHLSFIVTAAGTAAAHHLFLIGLFLGANVGIFVLGLCAAAGRRQPPVMPEVSARNRWQPSAFSYQPPAVSCPDSENGPRSVQRRALIAGH